MTNSTSTSTNTNKHDDDEIVVVDDNHGTSASKDPNNAPAAGGGTTDATDSTPMTTGTSTTSRVVEDGHGDEVVDDNGDDALAISAVSAGVSSDDNDDDDDDGASGSEHSMVTHGTDADGYATKSDREMEEARQIAEKETRMVRKWRFITADVLIMTFSTVVLTSYAILRSSEKQDFEEEYYAQAEHLAMALTKLFSQNAAAITGLAASIAASFASASTSTNNSIGISGEDDSPSFLLQSPDFQDKVGLVERLSSIEMIWYLPLTMMEEDKSHYQEEEEEYLPKHVQENLTSFVEGGVVVLQDIDLELNNKRVLLPPPSNSENKDFFHMVSLILAHPSKDEEDTIDNQAYGFLGGGFSLQATVVASTLETHLSDLVLVVQCQSTAPFFGGVSIGENNHSIAAATSTTTYHIGSGNITSRSVGDHHDEIYEDYQVDVDTTHQCTMSIYPTRDLELAYRTLFPEIFSLILALAFLCVSIAFFKYDILVDRRNEKLIDKFARSNAIVSSLFPKMFRDRLLGTHVERSSSGGGGGSSSFLVSGTGGGKLKSLMKDTNSQDLQHHSGHGASRSKPLADFFPAVSILFADIAGFTAWSSSREPHQVFTLLETLYSSFDDIAKRRRIFKVETIGDCYVAASGMPEPRKDHAVAMLRFACDILAQTNILVRSLEVTLGPDTGDLALRCGIHSGSVTAGILRGQKARFQLFGDTMNVASRMESNGVPRRIQVSQATASLVAKSGHRDWLEKRDEKIAAKGKGLMQTYWVVHSSPKVNSETSSTLGSLDVPSSNDTASCSQPAMITPSHRCRSMSAWGSQNIDQISNMEVSEKDARIERLVDWNVETLLGLINKIVAHRQAHSETSKKENNSLDTSWCSVSSTLDLEASGDSSTALIFPTPLEETKSIIKLPEFQHARRPMNLADVRIPTEVVDQLRGFVSRVATMYNDHPFHSLDHASHVVMSVIKLMSHIVAPPHLDAGDANEALLHDHTYGITSDPLTQFACAFSALIHDVDHSGVSNTQLVKEGAPNAKRYNGRSVAEQHSLDLSMMAFMSSDYDVLRKFIFATPSDLKRFRQIVVNAVMATDIADKDLKVMRDERWKIAFTGSETSTSCSNDPHESVNRKATIVIEHLMQASDVSHTMQHWQIFHKWNENLFREMYAAYKAGRSEKDPSEFWYHGELAFFDFYIIPLAKKLKECGVFGVCSDEYLNYARNNREEWEQKGVSLVIQMAERAREEHKEDKVK